MRPPGNPRLTLAATVERFAARLRDAAAAGSAPDWAALRRDAQAAGDGTLLHLAEAIESVCAVRAPQTPPAALEAYFEYALNGIVETAAGGRIQRCNPAAASILGASQRRLAAMTLDAALAPDAEARLRLERHRGALAEQGVSLTTLAVDVGGRRRAIEIASVDIGDGRQLHILDDITEQRQLTESLEAARRAADEASAAKSAFLANMSHEIRTPLNGIVGLERLLRLTPLTPQQRDYLDDLRKSSEILLALLGDILDLAKIEAGRVEPEPRPFEVDDLVETLATACPPAAADKPVRLVFHVDPDLPRRLVGDPLRLAQVATNLLANALKFTAAGHVLLAVTMVAGADGGPRLRLAVRDTGIGMTAAELARVFSPFVQADPSVTRRFGGTGLGLAIARGIATAMGGSLTASSDAGTGSEFVLEVPVAVAAGSEEPRRGTPSRQAIVVSPDPLQRGALAALLAAESLAVATCASLAEGAAAKEAAAAAAGAAGPALLVLDDAADGSLDAVAAHDPRAGPLILLASHGGAAVAGTGVAVLRAPATPQRLRRALAACASRPPEARAATAADDTLHGEFCGATALLVEDNAINRRVAAHLLDYAGIDVAVAGDGEEACAALLGPAARAVDIILMDVQMPEMDGLTATRKLRAAGIATPIVALTAGVSAEEREACTEAGMSDWLGKPIDVADLEAVLTRWLPARHAPGPPHPAPASVPDAPADTLPDALPGIDLAAALERFLGNRPAFLETLATFVGTHRPALERIPTLAAREDKEPLLRLLHTLAGSAATLGATDVEAAARALERAVRDGRAGPFDAGVRRLRDAFAVVAGAVAHDRFP